MDLYEDYFGAGDYTKINNKRNTNIKVRDYSDQNFSILSCDFEGMKETCIKCVYFNGNLIHAFCTFTSCAQGCVYLRALSDYHSQVVQYKFCAFNCSNYINNEYRYYHFCHVILYSQRMNRIEYGSIIKCPEFRIENIQYTLSIYSQNTSIANSNISNNDYGQLYIGNSNKATLVNLMIARNSASFAIINCYSNDFNASNLNILNNSVGFNNYLINHYYGNYHYNGCNFINNTCKYIFNTNSYTIYLTNCYFDRIIIGPNVIFENILNSPLKLKHNFFICVNKRETAIPLSRLEKYRRYRINSGT